jgi:2,3-bisphosphoglycerate-dependent phosphoglycerate mutase
LTTPERLRELAAAPDPRAGLTRYFFLSRDDEGVTELLLIRHAQIEATTMAEDTHLTELGREQAEVLTQYLSDKKIAAVYVSPTARARETAEPLARTQGLEVSIIDDLREIESRRALDRPLPRLLEDEYGPEGAEKALQRMQAEQTFDSIGPFLEPSASFRSRIEAAMDGIIDRHRGDTIAVVTHAPVIMVYSACVTRSAVDFTFNPRLTSITRVLAREDRRTLDCANTTPHFR